MRNFGLVVVLLMLGACAGRDTLPLVECTSPRPQVCTMEYAPVCAQVDRDELKEYSSACNACADDVVAGYVPGACAAAG
jgi:hypothetical protein